MSSALLANGNESGSVQATAGFMGKSSYLNPNPPKKVKRSHHKSNNGCDQDDVNVLPAAAITQTVSDDAYSFNQKPIGNNRLIEFNQVDLVTFNVAGCSNMELSDLRKRLVSELEKIRNLRDRVELVKLSGKTCDPNDQAKSKKLAGNKRSAPVASNKNLSNGFDDKGLMKECKQILNKLMKHKCAWIFNKPVDTAGLELHDYLQIVKHPMDLGTVKLNLSTNIYSSPGDFAADVRLTFNNALFYNPKTDEVHQWAEMLISRFEDLFSPIQEKISIRQRECFTGGEGGGGGGGRGVVEDLQESSWNQNLTFEKVKKPKPSSMARSNERMQSQSSASSMSNPLPPVNPSSKVQSPVQTTSLKRGPKPRPPKQPKPKAKDPNKREMSMEEKHKLGVELQSLPQEKIVQVVHIIKKRNAHLAEDGDEIELDIESLDKETLWELDRFSTNWKKMVSKSKRQALMNNDVHVADISTAELDDRDASNDEADLLKNKTFEDIDIDDDVPASHFPAAEAVEIEKDEVVGEAGDGIADQVVGQDGSWIADEFAGQNPGNGDEVVGQNHGDSSSSSSSSSSGSSSDSSSSSDSGSSSGSDDSDADDVQS